MKSKKIKVLYFAIAAILVQSTCVYAASSKDSYSQDDLNNIQPGFGWEDIYKSNYKVNTSVNSYSSTKTPKEMAEELGSDTKNTTNTSTTDKDIMKPQNIIASTQPSVGGNGNYWGKTASGKWMLFEQGVPVTGWKEVGGKWYYMDLEGIMQTDWVNDGANWYYLYLSGEMARNTYIGQYYLGWDGAMQ